MFIDKTKIFIKAGKGGDGSVSFRREKYVSHGGPDGGDGGRGGNVIFVVDEGENTLLNYKNRRKHVAKDGEAGKGRKFNGKNGEDIILPVPPGTVIKDADSGAVIHDMSDGKPYIAAKGGKGGWGNVHFATPTRQAPRFAKTGLPGEERFVVLELKMLADIGLAGFPNVGKSTFLSMVTSANPKIGNYPFTTLSPNLGVAHAYGKDFVIADIPGLIEGASDGLGLGHDFLRHIDRCRLILHIFDASPEDGKEILSNVKKINEELFKYSEELAKRPQILVANKVDMINDMSVLDEVKEYAKEKNQPLFLISAIIGEGTDELIKYIASIIDTLPELKTYESEEPDYTEIRNDREIIITVEGNVYHVEGEWLKKVCGNINFDDWESMQYFQKVLRNGGVIDALEKKGIQEGDTVEMYGIEFDFVY